MQRSVRVITYNIRKGKGASGRSVVEMDAIGKALSEHSADLVMCQEVFHCSRSGDSQTGHLARSLGLHSYYGANKFRTVGHHGNTTFTRLRAERFTNHDISTNRVERRGALYVRLRIDDTPLHVVNVHLGLNRWQREVQVRQVSTLVEELCPPGEPVVIAGDFNDWRLDLDRMIVNDLGFENALANADPQSIRTWHARRPVFNLDRIYVRNLKATSAGRLDGGAWHELSDHLPLMADLTLG